MLPVFETEITCNVETGELLQIIELSQLSGSGEVMTPIPSTPSTNPVFSYRAASLGQHIFEVRVQNGTDFRTATVVLAMTVEEPVTPPNNGNMPTVSVTANHQNDALTVSDETPVTLSWTSEYASRCILNIDGIGTSHYELQNSIELGPLTANTRCQVTVTCENDKGSVSDSVTITVEPLTAPEPLPAGSLDTSEFGAGTGKILDAVGNRNSYDSNVSSLKANFLIARFHSDGSLDATFGSGGKSPIVPIGNGGYDWAAGLVIQPDGRIVVAGSARDGGISKFAITRYWP